ncbi:hypothetical protein BC829DRAFT_406939 [Chytridium lagenaria]|nr:hypothetical protein BC829DRAFT_406939 [Chytridium lagenaria]
MIRYYSRINNLEHSVTITFFEPLRASPYPWIIVQFLNIQTLRDDLTSMNQDVQKFLFPVATVVILVGTLLALFISRQINIASQEFYLLSEFEFKSILQPPRHAVDRVLLPIYEFVELQESFHQMVTKLMHMSKQRGS